MSALGTVPGHTDVIKLRQIVRGQKNINAVGSDGIKSEVKKFPSD